MTTPNTTIHTDAEIHPIFWKAKATTDKIWPTIKIAPNETPNEERPRILEARRRRRARVANR